MHRGWAKTSLGKMVRRERRRGREVGGHWRWREAHQLIAVDELENSSAFIYVCRSCFGKRRKKGMGIREKEGTTLRGSTGVRLGKRFLAALAVALSG